MNRTNKSERSFFRLIFLFLFVFIFSQILFADGTFLRAPIWVYGESFPGKENHVEIAPPIKEMEELAIYIMSGMIYGWKFSYTPSDTRRKVDEFFELIPIVTIDPKDSNFFITDISKNYPRINGWVQYTHTDFSRFHIQRWNTILAKASYGRGRGDRSEGFEGIKKAYTGALLQAIREHARTLEKNKPKEIIGEVLLREAPRLFVDEGYFVAETRVSLKISEIIPYRVF